MLVVFILIMCLGGVALGRPSEPQCSQFDFVERTLEKVIKSEYKMTEFEQRINNTLRKLEEITGSKLEEMTGLEQRVTEGLERMMGVAESKVDQLTELEKIVNGTLTTLDNKVQAAITELSDRVSQKVAFNVFGAADLSLSTNEVIIFTNVLMNIGDGYDTDTGKFTSPVDGIFLFSTTLCTMPNIYLHFAITQNGGTNLLRAVHVDDKYSCGSGTVVADIKAGDKVWVKSTSTKANNIGQDTYRSNTFVGILLG